MDLTGLPYVPPGYGQPGYAGIPGTNNAGGAVDPTTAFLRGIAQLISGGGSLLTAGGDMDAARNAANVADPFASQRGQYQPLLHDFLTDPSKNPMNVMAGDNAALGRLENLMQNPGSITSMPGYQFGLNQALEGVNRGAGASGMLNSGNRLIALQDRGEGYARNWYNDTFNQMLQDVNANLGVGSQFLNAQGQGYGQLAQVSGATTGSPGAAAQALMLGRANQAGSLGSGIGGVASGLTSLLPALQRWLNGGSGGAGMDLTNPGSGVPSLDGTGAFNPDDLSGWLGQNSQISLGTAGDIFGSGLDIPFG